MAHLHSTQDTPTAGGVETDALDTSQELYRRFVRRSDWSTVVLGLNAWVVVGLWPVWFAGTTNTTSRAVLLVPLAALAAGTRVARRGESRDPTVARWLLIFGFPVTLCMTVVTRPAELNALIMSPLPMAIGAGSLVAYMAGAVRASQARLPGVESRTTPLGSDPWDAPPEQTQQRQRLAVTVVAVFGFAMVVIAPSWGGHEALRAGWGAAAMEGGVLTALTGAALAITVLTAFLGSGLRSAGAAADPGHDRNFKIASLLFLTLLGTVTYFVVT